MTKKTFIARCDDLGSSHSANEAISAVAQAGFFKNVSVMAPGPLVEQAASLLAGNRQLCFGLHTTLNAEWNNVKWGPVSALSPGSGLVDENGCFLQDPATFTATRPRVETAMREVDAQLEKLHRLGFAIRYIDSHMFPEQFIEGLDAAMAEFARKKGLVDHMHFYHLPPGPAPFSQPGQSLFHYLAALPAGQYFHVAHPALDTDEMRGTGNAQVSGAAVAKARAGEAALFSKKETSAMLEAAGYTGVRYDEAVPGPRLTTEEAKILLS